MGKAAWTRWGRGSCEGWSLDIGQLIASASRNPTRPIGSQWQASLNAVPLGDFPTREAARARAQEELTRRVKAIQSDWAEFQRPPAPRRPAGS